LVNKGYVLLKHPEAKVYQYRRKNIGQFFLQMFKYGEGRYKLVDKYQETLRYYHLVPVFMIFYLLFVVIGLILFVFNQISLYYLGLIFLPAFLYLIIDIIYTLFIMVGHGSLRHVSAMLIFPAIHIGYGTGFLKGLIVD